MSINHRTLYAKEIPKWASAQDIYNQLHFWCKIERVRILERHAGGEGRLRLALVTFSDVTSADVARRNQVTLKATAKDGTRVEHVMELWPLQSNQKHLIRKSELVEDADYTPDVPGSGGHLKKVNDLHKKIRVAEEAFAVKFEAIQKRMENVNKEKEALTSQIEGFQDQIRMAEGRLGALEATKTAIDVEFEDFQATKEAELTKLKAQLRALRGIANLEGLLNTELECPCCLEIKVQDVFQCPAGHLICKSCSERVNHCPICRAPLVRPLPRCLLAEKLAKGMKV